MVRRFAAQNRGAVFKTLYKESPAHVPICYINPMPKRPRPLVRSCCICTFILSVLSFPLVPGPLFSQTTHRPASMPRTVIIDTDAGSDDLMAIAFLLSRPDL